MEWKNANDDSILDVNKIMQDFSSISVTWWWWWFGS